MFKVGDTIICAYSNGTDGLKTQGEYRVYATYNIRSNGTQQIALEDHLDSGEHDSKRFMLKKSMIKQVMENARNV